MTPLLHAVTRYRPRLVPSCTISIDVLAVPAERMARGTLVTQSIARLVLDALRDQLVHALQCGEAGHFPGIGRFALELRACYDQAHHRFRSMSTSSTVGSSAGVVRPVMRASHELRHAVADLSDGRGRVTYREHVGLTARQLAALWNAEHPADPVRLVKEVGPGSPSSNYGADAKEAGMRERDGAGPAP